MAETKASDNRYPRHTIKLEVEVDVIDNAFFLRMGGGTFEHEGDTGTISSDLTGSSLICSVDRKDGPDKDGWDAYVIHANKLGEAILAYRKKHGLPPATAEQPNQT